LRALADSPDAFGSTWEVEHEKPDEYWAGRLSSAVTSQRQLPLVAEAGTALVGLVWGRIEDAQPESAHVFQMWVAPEARSRGCGTVLLQTVVAWARNLKATTVSLQVTCGDTAARRLYERAGFRPAGDPEPLRPGSTVLAQSMNLDLDPRAA
jgi:ribosomal protein S18 acetylase RimI-like enzyme